MKYIRGALIVGLLFASLILLHSAHTWAFNPFYRPPTSTGPNAVLSLCGQPTSPHSATACQPFNPNPFVGTHGVLTRAALLLSWIIGIASVAMIAYGGLQYIMSRGDAQKAVNARNTILYSCVGLLVAVVAQAIVAFVLNRF